LQITFYPPNAKELPHYTLSAS